MNKLIIALGLTLAASTGAFAQSSALDAYDVPSVQGQVNYAVGTSNELVSYDRADQDGSPSFQAADAGVDYTTTASIGDVANDQVRYDRAGNDGSPHFTR
ncbi:hypothetical protein ACK6D9_07290 [Hoeflea sp. Naph1]|uniref:hypothetical protein n=1 Tax=Hoeflea sp. Naph1 TaxID=3388653 RepID=UPI00398FC589